MSNSFTTALPIASVSVGHFQLTPPIFRPLLRRLFPLPFSSSPVSNQNCGQYPTHRQVLCFTQWYFMFILTIFPNDRQCCIRFCWQLSLTASVTSHIFTQKQLYKISTESRYWPLLSHMEHTQHVNCKSRGNRKACKIRKCHQEQTQYSTVGFSFHFSLHSFGLQNSMLIKKNWICYTVNVTHILVKLQWESSSTKTS